MLKPEEIDRVVKLAKLELDPDERELMQKQLKTIVQYMDMLDQADLDAVQPLAHISDIVNVKRNDEIQHDFDSEKALSQAPERSGRYFRVPRIIH